MRASRICHMIVVFPFRAARLVAGPVLLTLVSVILTAMAPPFTKPHIEDAQKRVRVLFNGKWLVDTTKAKLV